MTAQGRSIGTDVLVRAGAYGLGGGILPAKR